MQARYEEFRQRGAEVAAVTFTRPEKATVFLTMHPLPFPVLCDPTFTAYRQLELGRTSWLGFLRPTVLWRYVRLVVGGVPPEKPQEGADLMQLGGDFVVDGERRLRYAYRSRTATDRPGVGELLAALEG